MTARASAASSLRIDGVRKRYGDHEVLRGIDLDVAPHEVIALIGASGSGKSTLLKTVNLLEPIDDGQIFLDGEDISDPRANPDRVRARIGVVFQGFNLFPHQRVIDNIAVSLRVVHGMPKAEAHERAMAALTRVGLGEFASNYPDRLSGGQQQRVAIARAVAADQSLLLLDEVTSALDPELVGEVLELVRELGAEGTTILMATHEMAFAREVADRVAFLHAGEIHELGTPAEVFGSPQRARTREFLARVTH
ncbi:MAG TPA: amino acid ABC transporter ATP-binding protein [Microbacteriaceae bacterium]|nr:amino acid ABC transporter ATP-binding protein [Microbacteriaceae bacterium]